MQNSNGLWVVAGLLLASLTACADDESEAPRSHFPADSDIGMMLESRIAERRAVGIVVGVVDSDGTARVVAAGDAGPGAAPLSERSIFEIGSITKAFTGILLADMVARGEVELADPVKKYLPSDQVKIPTHGGREITLQDLATHQSGLPRMPDNFSPADPNNPYVDYTAVEMYAFLSEHALEREIGKESLYSNLGVGLLGHALARASGKTFENLVKERILTPLGMTSTGMTLSDPMQQRLVRGYDQAGNIAANWDFDVLAAAGGLRSDMADMLTFMKANIGANDSTLAQAMRMSHLPIAPSGAGMEVGLNWFTTSIGTDRVVWHNGGTGGYRTFAGFDPDRNVGVVVLTNSTHGADDIGMHLLNDKVPLTPAPPKRVEASVREEVLRRYVGDYALAPNFIITITVEDGNLWAQATGQQKLQVFPESSTEFFLKVVDAQITFELDENGQATGLVLHQGGASTPGAKQ